MDTAAKSNITVQNTVNVPVEKVWEFWSKPEHITKWANASDDWHTPHAENDLRKDGKFKTTMAAKDGSYSFDFEGTYTIVEDYKLIEYVIADSRKVKIEFTGENDTTHIVETFDAENTNSIEVQRNGWQAILDNFKRYTEANS